MSDPNEYTVGWICAITTEYVAARAFLDEEHEAPAHLPPRNSNDYTLGRVGKHNVVIAVLPMGSYGIASAARVAENMLHSFPNVRFGLMVGIGGGAPSQKHDIRLGDIVVSIPANGRGGVLQYDYGEAIQNKGFRITSILDQPPAILRAAVNGLRAQYEIKGHQLDASVDRILLENRRLRKKYQRPEQNTDLLHHSKTLHLSNGECCKEDCANDSSTLISRVPRDEDELNPAIHYGLIASADRLMSDALLRDKLSAENDVLCFETEAAGLMDGFPCLVIRGICDYSDSHKGDRWQGYSAMVASAYARDLLYRIPPQQVMAEAKIVDIIKPILTEVVERTARIELGMEFDKLPAVHDAQFDSYRNQYDEFCLPGTRTGVIDGISQWAHSPTGKPIFWLNGMAGTGKSTITRTLARDFKQSNMLGASFFFKRGENNRGSMQWLLPTIAKQLAQAIPELMPSILTAIRDDPDISTKGLPEQFEKLVLQPLLSVTNACRSSPVVIVIDALDECETQNDVAILLRLLPRVGQSETLITRIFLTSRPEILIRLGFSEIGNDSQDLVLHKIPEEVTEHDIALFLKHKTASIRRERLLPPDWLCEKDLLALVKLSVPLFIFAATICRLFQDHQLDPVLCLSEILAHGNEGSQLQGTYMPVLNRILDTRARKERVAEEFRAVVGAIILLENALSVPSLSNLIKVPESVIDTRLNSLHSVIRIPEEREMPLRLFHLSFRDFLLNPETKEKSLLWIDEEETHHKLALNCLSLCQGLRRNMCSLSSDGTLRTEIDQKTIDKSFPLELKYSCRFWAHHVTKSDKAKLLSREILQFLRTHFLHWLEAMNLLGLGFEAVSIIQWFKPNMIGNFKIHDLLREGERFALKNQYMADKAPLQLYSSSLVFLPKESIFRDIYRHEFPRWLERLSEVNESWEVGLRQLEYHQSDEVYEEGHHIAFSNDGQLIACFVKERRFSLHEKGYTIRLWHTTTGVLQQTLALQFDPKHGRVSSITFSSNGQLLACCFEDGAVAICDLVQHAVLNTLLPPYSPVYTPRLNIQLGPRSTSGVSSISRHEWKISYSQIGEPIQVWSLLTCEKTHQSPFNNAGPLTISSDGRLVACCLFYNCHQARRGVDSGFGVGDGRAGVIIWDTVDDTTEVIDSEFHNHAGLLSSSGYSYHADYWPRLTFSPNCQILAVESDSFIDLWDVPAKALKWKLIGRSNHDLLAFSFDDVLLASGSYHNIIHVWNLVSGTLQHVFRDSGDLASLHFSPNEYLLASSSQDGIIQLRDLVTISKADSNVCKRLKHGDRQHQMIIHPSELSGGIPRSLLPLLSYGMRNPDASSQPVYLPPSLDMIYLGAVSPDFQLFTAIFHYLKGGEKFQLWDISEGRCLHEFELDLPVSPTRSTAISHSNELLAIGYNLDDNPREVAGLTEIKILDIATGNYKHSIAAHGHGVSLLSFSPDDRFVIVAHNDMSFSLCNMAHGSIRRIECISTTIPKFEHPSTPIQDPLVAFSQGGLLAYTVNDYVSSVVHLCEMASGCIHHVIKNQDTRIRKLSFSLDGKLLAAATTGKKIYIWNVKSGLLRHSFDEKEFIAKLEFTADSSTLITRLIPSIPDAPWSISWDVITPLSALGEWISYRGENVLWLPSEFRPRFHPRVVKNTMIMAHSNGRLSFIRFDLTHMPRFRADIEVRRDLRDIEKQAEGNDQQETLEGDGDP